jgi:hypothetical protein
MRPSSHRKRLFALTSASSSPSTRSSWSCARKQAAVRVCGGRRPAFRRCGATFRVSPRHLTVETSWHDVSPRADAGRAGARRGAGLMDASGLQARGGEGVCRADVGPGVFARHRGPAENPGRWQIAALAQRHVRSLLRSLRAPSCRFAACPAPKVAGASIALNDNARRCSQARGAAVPE